MGNRLLAAILLLLGGLLSGCGVQRTNAFADLTDTITVVGELTTKADPVEQARLKALLEKEVREFKRLNPSVQVKLRALPTERFEQELQYRTQRGLGPDLMLLAGKRDLLGFQAKGYISAIELSPQEQANFRPTVLQSLRSRGKQLGLPWLIFSPLACFDRRRLPSSPKTFAELIQLAQKGHSFGLNYGPSGLDELISGFKVSLVPQRQSRLGEQQRLVRAMQWMREANLQPGITFLAEEAELRLGLQQGRFDWVPCSSGWLPSLRQTLGNDLGIAVLPDGPAGPTRPLTRMPTWVFGSQSTATQRRVAKQFVLYASNLVNQRNMALSLGTVLPVNPSIALPFKAYPDLAVINAAAQNIDLITLEQQQFLLTNADQLSFFADQVIRGVQSPAATAPRFQRLLDAMPKGDV